MKKKILILDSNIFYAPLYFKKDVLKELFETLKDIKVILPSIVLEEIKKSKISFPKTYLDKYINNFEIINTSEETADEAIINLAKKYLLEDYLVYVFTGDNKLRKILKDMGCLCIVLSKDKKLVIVKKK